MPYIKIWVHCVWTTYKRLLLLSDNIRPEVISHIKENARSKGIYIFTVNGYRDHLHAIISLGGKQNISDVMHSIKGESSFWINRNKLTRTKFRWQSDFYAVSVEADHLKNLLKYISNQEEHHKAQSTEEEINWLIEKYKLVLVKD